MHLMVFNFVKLNLVEHHRRKVKEWEKEDFYDSDEDQYLDRTGDLDRKRKLRKQRIGVKSTSAQDSPQTYESLVMLKSSKKF